MQKKQEICFDINVIIKLFINEASANIKYIINRMRFDRHVTLKYLTRSLIR